MSKRLIFFCLLVNVTVANASVIISDGDFSNWSFSSFSTGGGSASVSVRASGGNPGANLQITTMSSGSLSTYGGGTAIDLNYSTFGPLTGAFTLALDFEGGPGSRGQGQRIDLLVQQGNSVYDDPLGVTGLSASFTTLSFNGAFDPALFTLVIGSGPAAPDFSGATQTYFGFAGVNSASSSITQYYDNFRLSTGAPETSTWFLLMSGIGILCVPRLRLMRRTTSKHNSN